jgi:hypothetical protein
MHQFAEFISRLLKLLGGRRKEVTESVAEDDRLVLRTVARLRAECERQQAHSYADKIA